MIEIRHSIVVVSFNQRCFIRKALESLVNQELSPYEVLVLDDASSDGTADFAREFFEQNTPSFRYLVIQNEVNLGIAGNMKKAARVATGNVLSLLAADDFWLPNAVRSVDEGIRRSKLNPDSDVFVCFAPTYSIDESGESGEVGQNRVLGDSPFKTMIRKSSTFGKIGFSRSAMLGGDYPENIGLWADWAWDVSIAAQAKAYYILHENTHVHRRGVGVSSKASRQDIENSYLLVAEHIFEKHRGRLSLLDKIYLLGDIFYYRGLVRSSLGYACLGFVVTMINLFNSGGVGPAKSLASRYIPETFLCWYRGRKTL